VIWSARARASQRAGASAQHSGGRLAAFAGDQAGLAGADRLPGQRVRQRLDLVHHPGGELAGDAGDDDLVCAVGHGQRGEVRVCGGRGEPGDQRVRLHRRTGQQQRCQLGGGVQPAVAPLGFGELPRVGDRRAGRRGQRDRQLFIIRGELPAPGPLGKVQVAEDLLPDADRDTEEAGHRRMPRREPRRRRMTGQVSEPQRDRLPDQQPEDPPAPGQLTDPGGQLLIHPGVHELFQLPVTAQHAERRVPGTDKLPGRAHDLPQHHRQAQLAGYQGIGPQQPAQPPLGGQHLIGALHQLPQQLIQLQPRHVSKTQPAHRVGGAGAPRCSGSRRRTGSISPDGICENTDPSVHSLSAIT
jgi:hypothetical protein